MALMQQRLILDLATKMESLSKSMDALQTAVAGGPAIGREAAPEPTQVIDVEGYNSFAAATKQERVKTIRHLAVVGGVDVRDCVKRMVPCMVNHAMVIRMTRLGSVKSGKLSFQPFEQVLKSMYMYIQSQ